MATWTFIKRMGAPAGAITISILNNTYLIDDGVNPNIVTTNADIAENLTESPFLTLDSVVGPYVGPAIALSIPKFQSNVNYKQDTVITQGGVLFAANIDFYSGNTFSALDWYVVANGASISAALVAVRLATTAALPANTYAAGTITATGNGALTIDGKAVVAGDPILVKNEATGQNNGVYVAQAAGDASHPYVLTRMVGLIVTGLGISIGQGTTNGGHTYVLTTDSPITVGTTPLTFTASPVGTGASLSAQNVFTRRQDISAGPSRTNACISPRPGVGATGNWTADSSTKSQIAAGGGGTIPALDALGGTSNIMKLAFTGSGVVDFYPVTAAKPAVTAGDTWTFSGYAWQDSANPAARQGRVVIQWVDSGGATIATTTGSNVTYARGNWTRLSLTAVVPAGAVTARPLIEPAAASGASGDVYYLDAILYEKAAAAGTYFDGTFAGATWAGTVEGSVSNIVGETAYFRGRDPSNTSTLWQIDIGGKGSFIGMDAGNGVITSVADGVNPTDALNVRSGASTKVPNSFTGTQKVKVRVGGTNWCVLPRPGQAVLTGWSTDHATRTQVSPVTVDALGSNGLVLQITVSAGTTGVVDHYPATANNPGVNGGDTVTVSGYVWQAVGNSQTANGKIAITWLDASGATISTSTSANIPYGQGAWQRLSFTATAPTGAVSYRPLLEPAGAGAVAGDIFYVDAVLYETTNTLRPYFDGSITGCSWSGMALLSSSLCNAGFRAAGTNLAVAPRPGRAPSLAAWTADHATVAQVASVAGDAVYGNANVVRLTLTGTGAADFYPITTALPTASPGDVITASGYAWQAAANAAAYSGRVVIQWLDGGGSVLSSTVGASVVYNRGTWQRLSVTGTAPAGTVTFQPLFEPAASGAAISDIFYVDALLFEKAASLGAYFDGNSPGGAWTGTALASTSTSPGLPASVQGRDLLDLATTYLIDPDGKAWFTGADIGGQVATGSGVAVNPTDLMSQAAGDARYILSGGGGSAPIHSLPSKIYACTGRELGIYWESFLRTVGGLDLTHFQFDVTCAQGEQDEHRWFYTPVDADASAGIPWQLDVYYNNALIATYTTTLVITPSTAGSGVTRKLVVIGDSTSAVGNGAIWQAEMQRLLLSDPLTITQVGSLSGSALDSTSTNRTVHNDAVSGKTVGYFYSDPASPFVFSGSFNFANYLTAQSISLSASDWVMIHLGINDIFSYTDDASVVAQAATVIGRLDTMITSIKAAVSGIRIGILMTIPPSHSQDAFGINYTVGQTQWRYKRNRDLYTEALRAHFSDVTQTNVYALPLHLNIDTRNNFPTTTTAYNARNPATFAKVSNGVHPNPLGFYQMADSVYSYLKAFA